MLVLPHVSYCTQHNDQAILVGECVRLRVCVCDADTVRRVCGRVHYLLVIDFHPSRAVCVCLDAIRNASTLDFCNRQGWSYISYLLGLQWIRVPLHLHADGLLCSLYRSFYNNVWWPIRYWPETHVAECVLQGYVLMCRPHHLTLIIHLQLVQSEILVYMILLGIAQIQNRMMKT